MHPLTIDRLLALLADCAGASEALASGADPADMPFDDLGYDSLALMEVAARIEQDHGVALGDDELTDLRTPRALLDAVNRGLAGAS